MARKQLLILALLAVLLPGCNRYLHRIPAAQIPELGSVEVDVELPRDAVLEFLRFRQAYYQRDLVGQIEHLRRAALHDPDAGALRTRLAELYWYADDQEQAIRLCRQALQVAPDTCDAHLLLGQIASYSINLAEAERQLQLAVQCDPALDQAWHQLVYLLSNQDREEEALQILASYREHAREEAWVYRREGLSLEALGRHDEAIEALRQAVEIEPEDSDSLATVLHAFQEAGRMDEAVAFVESLVRRYPSSLLLREELVSLYTATGRYDDAVTQLISQYEQDPDNRDLYAVRSAGWLERLLRFDEAIDLLRKTLEEFPGNPHLTVRLAWVLEEAGDPEAALTEFNRIDIDTLVGTIAVRERARLLADLGREDEAITVLVDAVDHTSRTVIDPDLVVDLVRHEARDGRYQQARENLERIRNEAPHRYLLEKARLLAEMGELDRAVVLLQEEIERASVEPAPSLVLAQIYRDEGLFAEAVEVLSAVHKRLEAPQAYLQLPVGIYRTEGLRRAQIREYRIEVLVQLGFLRGLAGDREGALQAMNRARDLNPDDVRALNYIGYTFAEGDDQLPEAEAMIRRALTLAPLDPAILDSLGWVLFRQERYDEALETLEQAQLRMPDSAVIWQHLGEILLALDRAEEGIEALHKALDTVDEDDPEEVAAAERARELLQDLEGETR